MSKFLLRTPTKNTRNESDCRLCAPMEYFFGHMKDELDYKQAKTFKELKEMIDQYMIYYNESRS